MSAKTVQVKAWAQKRNSLEINAKQGSRKSLDSLRKVSTSSHYFLFSFEKVALFKVKTHLNIPEKEVLLMAIPRRLA